MIYMLCENSIYIGSYFLEYRSLQYIEIMHLWSAIENDWPSFRDVWSRLKQQLSEEIKLKITEEIKLNSAQFWPPSAAVTRNTRGAGSNFPERQSEALKLSCVLQTQFKQEKEEWVSFSVKFTETLTFFLRDENKCVEEGGSVERF